MTVAGFKAAVEDRLGWKLQPEREFKFERNIDEFGWQTGWDGRKHFTMFIENGRVEDAPGKPFKTGLREIAKVHKGVFRLTANQVGFLLQSACATYKRLTSLLPQHLILSDIESSEVEMISGLLKKYGLDNIDHSALRLSSSACVAFPTCGLAMAESERALPRFIDQVEKILEEHGLRHDSIVMRMSGKSPVIYRGDACQNRITDRPDTSGILLLCRD